MNMNIKIIYEDNDLLVINKPAGILVHPVKNEKDTLIDYFPSTKLVHRLDRDTSGLLLLAKNQEAQDWLRDQFKNRKITKKYIALVHGTIKDEQGVISKTISRSKKKGRIQTTAPIGKRREAITRYKVLQNFNNYSLLEVKPETGRTHQIRVHLASIGHPIAGDETYKFKRQPIIPELKRQFLHASYLKFSVPDGEIKEFYSPPPKDLQQILSGLI